MKLTARHDVEAPIGFVNAALTDFETWERTAMRRGADVERLDRLRQPGAGMHWKVGFVYRSKKRMVEIKLLTFAPERALAFGCTAKPAEGIVAIELAEMGPRRTRIAVNVDIKPKTLAARLFLQSLRLGKAKVTRRLTQRIVDFGQDVEERYRELPKA